MNVLLKGLNFFFNTHVQNQPQCVVPVGAWFSVTVGESNNYGLWLYSIAGFDHEYFEMAERNRLLKLIRIMIIIRKLLSVGSDG